MIRLLLHPTVLCVIAAIIAIIIATFESSLSLAGIIPTFLRRTHNDGRLSYNPKPDFTLQDHPILTCRPEQSMSHAVDDNIKDIKFLTVLKQVLSLLPGEEKWTQLLSPIDTTGYARIYDVAIRTRAYKKLFEAWEVLHLVQCEEAMYIRDDIVSWLRKSDLSLSHMEQRALVQSYDAYRYFITQLGMHLFPWTWPFFSDHMSLHLQSHTGRGIVFTAGNSLLTHLLTAIESLREHGCQLPVEVFYFGNEDLAESHREKVEQLPGVVTRDLSLMIRNEDFGLGGCTLKAFAILMSTFREVLFIDADAFFFRNPECLFDEPSYNETGGLFFIDRDIGPKSRKEWLKSMVPPPFSLKMKQNRFWTGTGSHYQESGVIVVDKWRHFIPLLLVTRLNGLERGDANSSGLYDEIHGTSYTQEVSSVFRKGKVAYQNLGDKETFWLGWELAGISDYSFHEGGIATMGTPRFNLTIKTKKESWADEAVICARQLIHLDKEGRPLWLNGGLRGLEAFYGTLRNSKQSPAIFREQNDSYYPKWIQDELNRATLLCMRSEQVFNITNREEEVLRNITAIGERNDVFN
jgi:alpha 1,3-mannosyltransferase